MAKLTKKEIDLILNGILSGNITRKRLPNALYLNIFQDFETSLLRGLDMPAVKRLAPEKIFDSYLKMSTNLRHFSAAKTYQITASLDKLADLEAMQKKMKLYLKTWQKTENDLIVKQSMTTNDWHTYEGQKDTLPFLKYVTAEDERVRHEHEELNGIIKKVDDSFWDEFLPANGYNCRCTVEQVEFAKATTIMPNEMKTYKQNINKQFRNNPAKSGFIFKETGKDKHSYFNIPKEDLKAVETLI